MCSLLSSARRTPHMGVKPKPRGEWRTQRYNKTLARYGEPATSQNKTQVSCKTHRILIDGCKIALRRTPETMDGAYGLNSGGERTLTRTEDRDNISWVEHSLSIESAGEQGHSRTKSFSGQFVRNYAGTFLGATVRNKPSRTVWEYQTLQEEPQCEDHLETDSARVPRLSPDTVALWYTGIEDLLTLRARRLLGTKIVDVRIETITDGLKHNGSE
ncbi:hypothetical protein C8F04DRAFT_1187056 [Mycena alexandri]|uniref:Uncharacterized protein n=1 Tax=Mycena alexandri TaxID=1745969 RepID=A0AAD6SPC0_9AGAR|nr:hypothetical protein C8F04DRAFT_1187056 [Mycena alexandri]